MRKVAIIGVGQLPFRARYPDKMYMELAFDAVKVALEDAGLTHREIDTAVYSVYCDALMRQSTSDLIIHDYLGLNGKPGVRVADGAASSAYAARVGYAEIASGLSEIVLVVGVQKAQDVIDPNTMHRGDAIFQAESQTNDVIWENPFTIYSWGLVLTAHMGKYHTPTEEQMAKVAVKNHRNAMENPNAQLHMEISIEEVLNSRIVGWPTTMYESCLYGESSAAIILASEDRAKELAHKPVWIAGIGSCHHNSTTEMNLENAGRLWAVFGAAKQAYKMAGINDPLHELDLVELNDLTAGIEIISYEELGLCPLGEGGRLVDEGKVERTGQLPVNPSGGRIGNGHIAGVSGVHSIAEVAIQLREEAGKRQVKIKSGRGMVSTLGGGYSGLSAAVILER